MKKTRIIMDMPITVEISDKTVSVQAMTTIFDYFTSIDHQFSTFKSDSEISRFNRREIRPSQLTEAMQFIFQQAEETKALTHGYFDIHRPSGLIDPSGIVKGWAIYEASKQIEDFGYQNYFVDAGGDIQVKGLNSQHKPWKIGIRNPFDRTQNVKVVSIGNKGIATSGTTIRGQHIYDPFLPKVPITDVVSLTVIGPNVYEADRMATAVFAMRDKGMTFMTTLPDFEAYSINNQGIATFTPGFEQYVVTAD